MSIDDHGAHPLGPHERQVLAAHEHGLRAYPTPMTAAAKTRAGPGPVACGTGLLIAWAMIGISTLAGGLAFGLGVSGALMLVIVVWTLILQRRDTPRKKPE